MEQGPEREPTAEQKPTSEELADACLDVLTPEDCAEIANLPLGEAFGYAFTLLLENGTEDPEEFLRSKGILE